MIKSRRMSLGGPCSANGRKKIIAYRVLVGNSEGKGPLERPRRRWVDNNKMNLSEISWGGVD
jgi:hypothetical protein